ncbi:NUDIX hydrolase [Salipiger mucosus]|uniref:Putative NAD regulator in Alphaproteobacteria n=1 Tax=Salipiger mucosus DSM 16094 TaxID=1123237 RepID=S9Q915_9RHOB|nr:hypothetical protein [Salipiger mucosus]EPX76487.1 putative NAD regulator in Alphaproteobacteria [Salipiger mucosus DSM 16094]
MSETDATINLVAVVITIRDRTPHVLTVPGPDGRPALPSGPLQSGHRTLQSGLRAWVERQTRQKLGYVEQLYTFGDRHVRLENTAPDMAHRTISIAYLALVSGSDEVNSAESSWRSWYEFFPWEDHRGGRPKSCDRLFEALLDWTTDGSAAGDPNAKERARLTFGVGGAEWDEEMTLERYEMLYEAEKVVEASLDRDLAPWRAQEDLPGLPMHADHRRVLATAISRLRAKIKYRPLLFELMPPSFTLFQLQQTAEAISGIALHKQNFRRLVAQQRLVEETGEALSLTGGRPAKLVRFRKEVMLERPAPGVRVRATRRGGLT